MNIQSTASSDPFSCYLGRAVRFRQRLHLVEYYEVHGRDLLFRLRPVGSGSDVRVTVIELLELLEAEEARRA